MNCIVKYFYRQNTAPEFQHKSYVSMNKKKIKDILSFRFKLQISVLSLLNFSELKL